ncbi:MAG: SUF system Fe-S cluster assembly regulator [Sphingomonadales bacterium]|nr:SUF system Fe-S cluster assembly regulator [Sphingomonadales bacterium]
MIRLSKLADYAVVLVSHMASDPGLRHSAADLAKLTHIPLPTVSKILGALARGGLLQSHRGLNGGFSLARAPQDVSVADVVNAVEGPIAVTHCLDHGQGDGACEILATCRMAGYWQRINTAIDGALKGITFAEVSTPLPAELTVPLTATPSAAAAGACHDGFGA